MKVLITESFNIAGTTLFAFKVLPTLDLIQAIIIMNSFSLVPSMLNIFFRQSYFLSDEKFEIFIAKCFKKDSNRVKFDIVVNLMAFLVQISIFGIMFSPILPIFNTWELCLSIIFLSMSYWENFINPDLIGISKTFSEKIKQFKKTIEISRHRTLLFINLWKIGLLILICYGLFPNLFNPSNIGPLFMENQNHYLALISQTISSFMCYYLSLLACKLCMQRTSFVVPLILSFPIMLLVVLLLCKFLPEESALKTDFFRSTYLNNYTNGFFLLVLSGGYLTYG